MNIWISFTFKLNVPKFREYLKVKCALMIYERYLESQRKWNKAFEVSGYRITTDWRYTEESTINMFKSDIKIQRKKWK